MIWHLLFYGFLSLYDVGRYSLLCDCKNKISVDKEKIFIVLSNCNKDWLNRTEVITPSNSVKHKGIYVFLTDFKKEDVSQFDRI